MQLPPRLTAALDALLEGVARSDLAARAKALSAGYRAGAASHAITRRADALAYALARGPATFAANAAVLTRLAQVMPDFAPATLLDAGAGTGAASWAAQARWPGLAITMLDANASLRELAQALAQAGGLNAQVLAGDIHAVPGKADLVVASYVLAELPLDRIAAIAAGLWEAAGQVLVLVEPGTPAGFARIRAARVALIAAGAHVAAPCTHDKACPMPRSEGASRSDNQTKADDWCHFSQRLARSRDHMALKAASVPFEDERYSYVVVTREKVSHGARILAPPLQAKPGLTFKLCDADGLRAQFVASRDKDDYRRARKLGWGDLFD